MQLIAFLSLQQFRYNFIEGRCLWINKLQRVQMLNINAHASSILFRGWSGGAMVLGKLSVPGRPTNLD